MSERWEEIHEDFYNAVQKLNPPAPVIATLNAMCHKIALLEEEVQKSKRRLIVIPPKTWPWRLVFVVLLGGSCYYLGRLHG